MAPRRGSTVQDLAAKGKSTDHHSKALQLTISKGLPYAQQLIANLPQLDLQAPLTDQRDPYVADTASPAKSARSDNDEIDISFPELHGTVKAVWLKAIASANKSEEETHSSIRALQQLLFDNDFTEGHQSFLIFNLGVLHNLVGHLHIAAEAFEDASLLAGAHIVASFCCGVALYDTESYVAARKAFKLCSLMMGPERNVNYFKHGLDFVLHKTMVQYNESKCSNILLAITETHTAGINRFPPGLLFKPTTRSKPGLHLDLSGMSLDDLSLKKLQSATASPSLLTAGLQTSPVPMMQSPLLEGALDIPTLRQERMRKASKSSDTARPARPEAPRRPSLMKRAHKSVKDLKAKFEAKETQPPMPEGGKEGEDEGEPWMQEPFLPENLRGGREQGF